MTEEQVQQPVAQPVVAPQATPAAAPAKKSNVWLWLIGGCLTILMIIGLMIIGGIWWTANKVKKTIRENQPKLEQWQKDAEDWQKSAEEMQKKADKWQESIPNPENMEIPADFQ